MAAWWKGVTATHGTSVHHCISVTSVLCETAHITVSQGLCPKNRVMAQLGRLLRVGQGWTLVWKLMGLMVDTDPCGVADQGPRALLAVGQRLPSAPPHLGCFH